jgi:hypothetical protein
MRPVISVSLSGRAYQLEDDAHAALAGYLVSAERSLAANPDRAEILADLEQAIADNGSLAALRQHVRPAWHQLLRAWQTLLHGRQ